MRYLALRDQIAAIRRAYGEDFDWGRIVVDLDTSEVYDAYGKETLRAGDCLPALGVMPCDYLIDRISEPFTDDQGRQMIQLSLIAKAHEEGK